MNQLKTVKYGKITSGSRGGSRTPTTYDAAVCDNTMETPQHITVIT